jgi:hypothetical protein
MVRSAEERHPHLDPRHPGYKSTPGTNPPVFVWRPLVTSALPKYRLLVSKDPGFRNIVLNIGGLADPIYLPEKAFVPGRYWWKWSTRASESTVYEFSIDRPAVTLEVPPVREWLATLPSERPRLYIRPENVGRLRSARGSNPLWPELQKEADAILQEDHELAEPGYLPNRSTDYPAFHRAFQSAMWESRSLARGAEIMGMAWLISGDTKYADATRRRILSLCSWDPDGSSSIENNDEAHMSILWYGISAADWIWDQFSPEQRRIVIGHIRKRAKNTFAFMHNQGTYGVDRFDSHAGREIVFLAWTLLAFHEDIPDSSRMLEWLRPVLCGIWPVWAEDDGSWAEGISYSLAYVTIMSRFAYILKHGAHVDLFARPFWKGHSEWRLWCFPSYAEWIGFGDHSEAWKQTWLRNADLVELIDNEADPGAHAEYVRRFRERAANLPERGNVVRYATSPMAFLGGYEPAENRPQAVGGDHKRTLKVFPGAGWAAVRTDHDSSENDLAFIFRSSPYGSISHSHANNNDFIIHVAGTVMAMPSGYYAGYGSPHHANWVWHTKSHNCATLSGSPQKMRSYESRGSIVNSFENEHFAYFAGIADESYDHLARRCRRHVIYIKGHHAFVLIDEFVAKPGIQVSYEWNIHTWHRLSCSEEDRTFLIESDDSHPLRPRLLGSVMHRQNCFFTQTEGWDPPPQAGISGEERRNQYHLRFSTGELVEELRLPVVIRTESQLQRAPSIQWRKDGDANTVVFPDTAVRIPYAGPAIARISCFGREYTVADWGLT